MSEEFNPRKELLKRYREAFSPAWANRANDRSARRYRSSEADFLPASLAVSERPTPIMPHVALWLLCFLFLFAVLWSLLGRMDVVVVASGKILASGKTKIIQSVEPQVVHRILVSEGQSVAEGDVLIEFDRTSAEADSKRFQNDYERAEAMSWAYQTLLENIGETAAAKPLRVSRPLPPQAADMALASVQARWSEYRAKVERADADLARRVAERKAIEISMVSLRERVRRQESLEADYRKMMLAKAAPRHAHQEQEVKLIELGAELSRTFAQRKLLDLAIAEGEAVLALTYATDKALWRERLIESEREAIVSATEHSKASVRLGINVLRAPTSGRVQQLAVAAPGAVVTSGQQIMILVPLGEADEIEAQVENRDVGFLRVGQTAAVKLEAYDYTRYGTLPATITMISADAVADERGVLRYPVRLKLTRNSLVIAGRTTTVAPGMVAYADIMSGRRSVFSYFLSPIMNTVQESLRER